MEAATQTQELNGLERAFIEFVNSSMNKTISFDPEAKKKLESFQGKIIQVELLKTPFVFQIEVSEQELIVHKYNESLSADTVIKGTPIALFAMNSDEPISGLPAVQISGDASTGQYFQKWLKSVKPDWEEAWCQLLGDGMGVRVSDTIHGLLQFGKKLRSSLLNDSKEYLLEESRELISSSEMEDFLDAVDDIKSDVEHLQRRIGELASKSS